MSIVLAVDIGTGSAKALAANHSGEELYARRKSYATHHPKNSFAEQNPDEVYAAVKEVIAACPDEIKKEIAAISFSSAMHSTMAVDRQGSPLIPLIVWQDLRSKNESRALRTSKDRFQKLAFTGTPVHPMAPLPKIMWLKKHLPEIFSRAYKFIGIKEYIWYKLFGKFEVDYGIASATGLLETGRLGWFPDALSYAGISESQLSLPVSPYHVQTLNNSAILADLGLRHPVPCVIGSSDGCLAHLGSMAMHHDSISLTIGTSGAVRRVARSSQPDLLGRTFRYHLDAETIIEGGATNNGAILLDWYSKNFLNKETNTESFIAAAASIRAGSEGLIFLPYVFGERSPHNDPDATGVFLGVRQHHTHAHFMRAILEGIGFSLHSIAGLLEQSSGRYSRVMASGGFTRSAIWVQVIADIFGRPVSVSPYEDASALGAAMVGFQAIGEDFRPAHAGASTFTPDISAHAEYARMFAIFQKLYDPLRGSFHQLSNPGH